MREQVVVQESQCLPVPDSLSFELAAFGEPLAVALHAVRSAGTLLGKTAMVVGAGPIGALVVMAARLAGASHVIAVDIVDQTLAACARVGATRTINAATDPGALDELAAGKGTVDVCFEASGNYAGLANCIRTAPARHHRHGGHAVRQQRRLPVQPDHGQEPDLRRQLPLRQ